MRARSRAREDDGRQKKARRRCARKGKNGLRGIRSVPTAGFIIFDTAENGRSGLRRAGKAAHSRYLVFEGFVNAEKMGHFVEHVAGKLGDIRIALERGIAEADGDYLFVGTAAVVHVDNADRRALNERHRENGFAREHENVESVAVVGEGERNKAVVGGIDRGRIQNSVQTQHSRGLVYFVLGLTALGNLYYGFEFSVGYAT